MPVAVESAAPRMPTHRRGWVREVMAPRRAGCCRERRFANTHPTAGVGFGRKWRPAEPLAVESAALRIPTPTRRGWVREGMAPRRVGCYRERRFANTHPPKGLGPRGNGAPSCRLLSRAPLREYPPTEGVGFGRGWRLSGVQAFRLASSRERADRSPIPRHFLVTFSCRRKSHIITLKPRQTIPIAVNEAESPRVSGRRRNSSPPSNAC